MTMAARDRGDRSDRGSGASGRLASLCSDRAASFSQLPIDRIEQIIRPSEPQRHALEALQAASARASDELKASCPQTTPQSLLDRLRAVEQRLFAMTTALKSVRPALTEFYGLLSDEQKARFNMMGQTQNEGNSVRANRQVGAR
jgi:LTXXQ motif family protein